MWHNLGDTYDEACEEYDRLQRTRGSLVGTRALIRDIVEDWLKLDIARRRGTDSRKGAEYYTREHFVALLGVLRLSDLRDDHCREYANYLAGLGWKKSTERLALKLFVQFLRWCEKTGRVERSPFPADAMPKAPRRGEPKALTDDEVRRVCSIPGPLGFLCRWGIESMLSWCDLSRSTAAMIDEKGILTYTRAKTGVVSIVPIGAAMREEIRLRIGPKGRKGPLLDYAPKSDAAVIRDVRSNSGVGAFTLHKMRHTGAMLRLRAGWTLEEIQVMLGHTSVSTTQIYAKANRAMIEEKAKRMPAQTVVPAVVHGFSTEPIDDTPATD